MTDIRFGVLGPITAWHHGDVVTPRSSILRAALGLLLIAENRPLTADRVRTLVHPDHTGDSRAPVAVIMSRLRAWLVATFGQTVSLRHHSDGYVLAVPPDQVDLGRFRFLSAAAGQAEDNRLRLTLWEDALALWRDDALADVVGVTCDSILLELRQLRLNAVLGLADAALAIDEPGRALPHVVALAGQHPLDERLHAAWALLLAGAGRQAEALAVIRRTDRRLVDEFGIRMGQHLRAAQHHVLRSSPHAIVGTAWVSDQDEIIAALATLLNADRPRASQLARTLNGKRLLLVVDDDENPSSR